MPLEALGRQRKGRREDDALLADSAALQTVLSRRIDPTVQYGIPLVACYVGSRTLGRDTG